MGFIIEGFLGLAILLGGVWMALFLRAKREDDARRTDEAREARVQQLLQTPGERLYCVACQHPFEGPLSEDGCPVCRSGSFVVPERLRPGGVAGSGTAVVVPMDAPPATREEQDPAADVLRVKRGGGPEA